MKKLLILSLILFLFTDCTNQYQIFENIDTKVNTYFLYILPISDTVGKINTANLYIIDKPILIDDPVTLKTIKTEWIFKESTVPKEKKIQYRIELYENDKKQLTVWLDEKYKILIWQDKLLEFEKSLLLKHEENFKYLSEFYIEIPNVESARLFEQLVINSGGLLKQISRKQKYWKIYDGQYKLKRMRENLKPSRQIGKLREKINKDFISKEFKLIDFEFITDSDSMIIIIASDSSYINHIPEHYKVVAPFKRYGSIELHIIGLEKSVIKNLAYRNKIELIQIAKLSD